jgi:hypothetical protein
LSASLERAIAVGNEPEAEKFDEKTGEDEGEALPETCQQEKGSKSKQPARNH